MKTIPELPTELLDMIRHGEDYQLEYKEAKTELPKSLFDNGKWGLIGGLLEMNETYEQAALREAHEETGLEIKLNSFLGIYHNHNMVWSNGDAAQVISAYFTASIISGEPRIVEESYELRFFETDEIPTLFAEDHIAALDAYFSGVRYPLLQENGYSKDE